MDSPGTPQGPEGALRGAQQLGPEMTLDRCIEMVRPSGAMTSSSSFSSYSVRIVACSVFLLLTLLQMLSRISVQSLTASTHTPIVLLLSASLRTSTVPRSPVPPATQALGQANKYQNCCVDGIISAINCAHRITIHPV